MPRAQSCFSDEPRIVEGREMLQSLGYIVISRCQYRLSEHMSEGEALGIKRSHMHNASMFFDESSGFDIIFGFVSVLHRAHNAIVLPRAYSAS